MKELINEVIAEENSIFEKLKASNILSESDLHTLLIKSILEESFGEGKEK